MTTRLPADPLDPPRHIAELEARLQEAEETLDAIRNGDVDAVVIGGPSGQQVYTLENADRPYRVLIEQMQEGAVSLSDDGTILYCNERFALLTGLVRDMVTGTSILRFFDADEALAFRALLDLKSKAAASGEFSLRAQSGTLVPVNVSIVDLMIEEGMSRIVCGIVTDLTNNRHRTLELAAANKRLAREIEERNKAEVSLGLALDAAGMGTWDLDLATGQARRSLRHDQIFGYPELRRTWRFEDSLRQFHPDDREAVSTAFEQARTTGAIEIRARIRRAQDEATRWVHIKGQTYYEDGGPVRIAGVITDVTDQRAIEEQLRQAQKMEAVGQLTGGVAHDFNNLLMIISGSLDMLSRRIPSDPKTEFLLKAAQQGVARGSKLNQQLLAFSRRQDLHAEPLEIDTLIASFEHLLDRALGEAVTLKIVHAPEPWQCRIDPHQLETAILNLAINARDAMPDGGALTLEVGNRFVEQQVASTWEAQAGDYIVITVSDTGAGMPAAILGRAFEPFFTTKEVGKGTGLGLSQVYGFAKQSHGFVTISSEDGVGTSVSIFLPRTEEEVAEPAAEVEKNPVVPGQGVVLVVEDDPDVRATTSGMLGDLGYAIRQAATARAAINLVESGMTIDLVFSDVIMPDGMSGVDLARELRIRWPALPVLLTSGYTAQRVIPGELAEDLRLLRKPYTQAELSQAVQDALERR